MESFRRRPSSIGRDDRNSIDEFLSLGDPSENNGFSWGGGASNNRKNHRRDELGRGTDNPDS